MAKVWPTTDAFPHGSPAYGDHVIGYLGLRPLATGLSAWGFGRLVRAYGAGTASPAKAGGPTNAAAWMRRQVFAEDSRSILVFRCHGVAGSPTTSHVGIVSLFARVQGGNFDDDGDPALSRHDDVDCYEFRAQNLSATTIRYQLVRWNAGTPTTLATADLPGEDVGHFLSDATLALTVETVGAEVHVAGSVAGVALGESEASLLYTPGGSGRPNVVGSLVSGSPAPAVGTIVKTPSTAPKIKGYATAASLIDVVSAVDADASRITGDGRCGFGLPTDVDHGGGIKTVGLASLFQVEDIAAGSVVWRDEFHRAAIALCEQATDAHGTVGRNLASDYALDAASVETADHLDRSTAEEAAEAVGSLDLGHGVNFGGAAAQPVNLPGAANIFPASPPAAQVQFTLAHWVRIDTNRDGNQFYEAYNGTTSPDQGVKWGWRDAGGGLAQIEVILGGKTTEQSFLTATFDPTPYLGQTWCFVCTYKANANTVSGEGRIRVYVGRLGAATLLGEIVVPADTRPLWNNANHQIGVRGGATPGADAYFDGVFDDTSIFFRELTAAEVDDVCNQYQPRENLIPLGLVHGIDWEVSDEPVAGQFVWQPWYPTGIANQANWWTDNGLVTIADPGLVPANTAPRVAWWQRQQGNAVTQSRSLSAELGADFSSVGIVLRGTPGASPAVYTGYRVEVSPGSPAAIDLYRVVAGVATKLGRQDPQSGPVAVTTGVAFTLEMGVRQVDQGGDTGPVLLTVAINGADVPFVALAPGVAVDVDGNLIDSSEARILSGAAVGFAVVVDTQPTVLDDWQEGSVTPPVPSPDDFESVIVPAESDGAFGDLAAVLTPDWAIEPMHLAPRVEHHFESGHHARVAVQTYERRRFACSKVLTAAEYAALRTFWDEHEGAALGFTWDPSPFFPFVEPEGVFHFVEDSLRVESAARHFAVQFELEERVSP